MENNLIHNFETKLENKVPVTKVVITAPGSVNGNFKKIIFI